MTRVVLYYKSQQEYRALVTHLIYIDLGLGRRLEESTVVERPGQVGALVFAHNSFVVQIAFIAHKDHRHVVGVLHAEDLFAQILQIVESGLSCD